MDHDHFMNLAFQEALKALDEGEVPVGAVIEKQGAVIGRGYNRMRRLNDGTAHAEIVAIGAASNSLGDWRLDGCTLYVTLEPCLMCLGAVMQTRIGAIVYASRDPRLGAVDTHSFRQEIERSYRHFPTVIPGIMQGQCARLLTSFFQDLRNKSRGD